MGGDEGFWGELIQFLCFTEGFLVVLKKFFGIQRFFLGGHKFFCGAERFFGVLKNFLSMKTLSVGKILLHLNDYFTPQENIFCSVETFLGR